MAAQSVKESGAKWRRIIYEHVTSKHMDDNRPVLIAKFKAGYHIVGLRLDERFGAHVKLAYLFYKDRRNGFAAAFSLEQYSRPLYRGQRKVNAEG